MIWSFGLVDNCVTLLFSGSGVEKTLQPGIIIEASLSHDVVSDNVMLPESVILGKEEARPTENQGLLSF